MKVYTKKAPDVLTFAEGRELGLPEDLLEFAVGNPGGPVPLGGLRRDQAVRQYMRDNSVTDYYRAFHVVALGADPADVFAAEDRNSVARAREREVAARIAQAFAGTMAVRDPE